MRCNGPEPHVRSDVTRARPYHTRVSNCKLETYHMEAGNPACSTGFGTVHQRRRATPGLSNPTVTDRRGEVGAADAQAWPYTTSNVKGQRPSAPQ